MLGAILGDIIGSRFEGRPHKSTSFDFFTPASRFTDDTVLTCATAEALFGCDPGDASCVAPYSAKYREFCRAYPSAGYGGSFISWCAADDAGPYGSFGNGSAMRVSPVGWWFDELETVLDQAEASASASHNHPEGIKGAQAVAGAIFLARTSSSKADIRAFISSRFGYNLSRSLADIRPTYHFDVTCQGSVPEAIIAFLEADNLESAIRNAVSLGGDSDTQGAMAGSIAEAFYHPKGDIPETLRDAAMARLDERLADVARRFSARMGRSIKAD
ncbi:ADP-ribosylglycohydrolase [Desulfocurvibacter africanus PCS]|uniref:ADP-ribosylglycohydrolase n=1 Tax=Desulfocurvibacter africanus PCS TaxID=1262666 RepID=M5Q0U2_DESAF|nr:ADP-ribosylglycohydrolase family protein [Desulfocurvibacter africanus]EMG36996.1 ADP-ribosylglycohydrolase [Desulfocurvibacter africanus PCS]